MRRLIIFVFIALVVAGASLQVPAVRSRVRALVRPEAPAPITPLALIAPPAPSASPYRQTSVSAAALPSPAPPEAPAPIPTAPVAVASPAPLPSATPTPLIVNGRVYDAYIPAATKDKQAYQYSCEFDAAWVIFKTYGLDVSVDEMVNSIGVDRSIEPYIEETRNGFIIHGGDILHSYSGDYTRNFLARSTSAAMRKVFEQHGLAATPIATREEVEGALRRGELIWMKTTVDFKPWRPATWLMPDGSTHQTVLGNDHAVVVIGFNAASVVIRDVLGPTSSNWQRPYEYEVGWDTFMASWGAQSFDGLAVAPQ